MTGSPPGSPVRPPGLAVGDEVEVEVTGFAHGGSAVARHEGQVLFVRHALPGERVRARVGEIGSGGRFVRADAVGVLVASPDRVEPPCPWAGPGRCGGCDLQHVALGRQRSLKAGVVREQMSRLAGLDLDVEVEPVPGDVEGLRWRTRVEFAVDDEGRAGLRRHRSHEVVPVDTCRIAAPGVTGLDVTARTWPGADAVDAVSPSVGEPVAVPVPVPADEVPEVTERVVAGWSGPERSPRSLERDFAVSARAFWQVHPGAAATFLSAVMEGLGVRQGERAVDLYGGSGLFSAALAQEVGPTGQVVLVEADARATDGARVAFASVGNVVVVPARVDDALGVAARRRGRRRRHPGGSRSPLLPERADVVVLDPPRTGAGPEVCRSVAGMRPRAVAYVACDPAALARDTRAFLDTGYRLESLRAFDAFPMTHHVECVAVLVPEKGVDGLA